MTSSALNRIDVRSTHQPADSGSQRNDATPTTIGEQR